MAELADALDSGSSGGNFVEVQVLLPAPQTKDTALCGVFCLWWLIGSCRTQSFRIGEFKSAFATKRQAARPGCLAFFAFFAMEKASILAVVDKTRFLLYNTSRAARHVGWPKRKGELYE